MNTTQLQEGLKKLGIEGQVLPWDHFDPTLINPNKIQAFIINIGSSGTPGYHWTVIYNLKGRCFFFDSYGRSMDKYFPFFNIPNIKSNPHRLQSSSSAVCGHMCLHYLYLMSKKLKDFSQLPNVYDLHQLEMNDTLAHQFVKKNFCPVYRSRKGDQCCEPCYE